MRKACVFSMGDDQTASVPHTSSPDHARDPNDLLEREDGASARVRSPLEHPASAIHAPDRTSIALPDRSLQNRESYGYRSSVLTKQELDNATPLDTAGMVRVFSEHALLSASARSITGRKDLAKLSADRIALAARMGGWREVPWRRVHSPFDHLGADFSNFAAVIEHLKDQWTLAGAARLASQALIEGILMYGAPGVGKTYLAQTVAQCMKTPCRIYSAGNAQEAFQLCGSDAGYNNARPGLIFDLLAHNDTAAPVLVIDEIDKLQCDVQGTRESPLRSILDLTEPNSAAIFRDNCVQIEMDASRIIVLCTANDIDLVPPYIRSRLALFEIHPPSEEQKRLLVHQCFSELEKTHCCPDGIYLDEDSVTRAIRGESVDIRALRKSIIRSFAAAVRGWDRRVIVTYSAPVSPTRKIGFI